MKTMNLLKRSAWLPLCITSYLVFTGCQKDDMALPTNKATLSESATEKNHFEQRFQMLDIKHTGISPKDKSYHVTLMSDGNLTFTGMNNTAVLGSRDLQIDKTTLDAVRNYFSENHFNEFTHPPIIADFRTVVVSYRMSQNSLMITNMANDNGSSPLSVFTENLEGLLGIASLVGVTRQGEPIVNEQK